MVSVTLSQSWSAKSSFLPQTILQLSLTMSIQSSTIPSLQTPSHGLAQFASSLSMANSKGLLLFMFKCRGRDCVPPHLLCLLLWRRVIELCTEWACFPFMVRFRNLGFVVVVTGFIWRQLWWILTANWVIWRFQARCLMKRLAFDVSWVSDVWGFSGGSEGVWWDSAERCYFVEFHVFVICQIRGFGEGVILVSTNAREEFCFLECDD